MCTVRQKIRKLLVVHKLQMEILTTSWRSLYSLHQPWNSNLQVPVLRHMNPLSHSPTKSAVLHFVFYM